jgi:hypothetical protein
MTIESDQEQEQERQNEQRRESARQQKIASNQEIDARILVISATRQARSVAEIQERITLFRQRTEQKLKSDLKRAENDLEVKRLTRKYLTRAALVIQAIALIGIGCAVFHRVTLKNCNDIEGIHNKECTIVN